MDETPTITPAPTPELAANGATSTDTPARGALYVTLGGRTYRVERMPIRPTEAWRQQLRAQLAPIADALELAHAIQGDDVQQALNSLSVPDVAGVMQRSMNLVLGSITTVLELLYAYSPALADDRERIEETAYDDEAIAAFTKVLQHAYPLGKLASQLVGSMIRTTSKS